MTKLSKEQIEKEREQFESWANSYFGCKQDFISVSNNLFNGYTEHQLTVMWHAWLVRAETGQDND